VSHYDRAGRRRLPHRIERRALVHIENQRWDGYRARCYDMTKLGVEGLGFGLELLGTKRKKILTYRPTAMPAERSVKDVIRQLRALVVDRPEVATFNSIQHPIAWIDLESPVVGSVVETFFGYSCRTDGSSQNGLVSCPLSCQLSTTHFVLLHKQRRPK
jgi:hypothetical protein